MAAVDFLIAANVIVLIGLFIRSFLPSYLSEKGKNLATKEDVAEITRRIETVRSEMNRAGHAHNVQFEAELRSYTEIWEAVVGVQRASETLRQTSRGMFDTDAEFRSDREQRYADFTAAVDSYLAIANKRRPFYTPAVFATLGTLTEALSDLGFHTLIADGPHSEHLEKRAARRRLTESSEAVCNAIRARMAELRSV